MSKEEELFKQQLDAMLSSQTFEMAADNWSSMELLLKQQQRKRRGFFILFTSLGLLLLSSLLWFLMPQTQNSAVASTTVSIKNKENAKHTPKIITQQQTIAVPAVKASATSNKPASLKTQSAPKPQAPQDIKPTPANIALADVKTSDGRNDNSSAQNDKTPTHAVESPINDSKAMPLAGSEPITDPQNTGTTIAEAGISSAHAPTVQAEFTVPIAATQTPIVNKHEAPNTVSSATQAELPTLAKTDSLINLTALKPDTTAAMIAKPDTDYVARKQLGFLLEAGITALSGWQENDKRDAAGLNPLFGAHISYPLTPDLDVVLGIQYTTVGHLKYSKYTATTSHLDLGRVDQSLVFTPTRLHYLLLPMQTSLKLDKKQSIGAGISLAYLLTADSKVETYTYNYFGSALVNTEKKKGYTEGFRNIDAQISLHYKYRFSSYLQANIALMFGLMDVKTGEALPSAGFERNSGAKISLLYTLFGK